VENIKRPVTERNGLQALLSAGKAATGTFAAHLNNSRVPNTARL
jgi:hypothetical protein